MSQKPENRENLTEEEIDHLVEKICHDSVLEGHNVPQSSKDLLRKNIAGEITGDEYRALILSRTEENYKTFDEEYLKKNK